MKIYNVFNDETGYRDEFYSLTAAKKAMKENNAKGTITRVSSNGDWTPLGEIKLNGCNKHFIANTRMTKTNY